jgi:hypothetical protein
MVSCAAPLWANIVRDRVQPRPLPPISPLIPPSPAAAVNRDDFLALYERCIAGGLKARFVDRHVAGLQEASLTCSLSPPLPNITTKHRRRCRRRRVLAATEASRSDAPPLADATMPCITPLIQSAPSPVPPRLLPPLSAPEVPPTVL